MSTLLLRLAGPLQSWGDASRFARRETRPEPTKSGVLGLLAAAQGRRRTDPVEDLAALRFGVRVDQPGRLVRDFQTAIDWRSGESMPLSQRYYLADAVFVAGIEGDRALLDGLADAVRRPRFPLYLGRRSCPTEGQVVLGVVDHDLETALREADWQAATWHRRTVARHHTLTLLADAPVTPGTPATPVTPVTPVAPVMVETVRDVPVSYSPERREYTWRQVARLDPVQVDNPAGHDDLDFMSVLGGL